MTVRSTLSTFLSAAIVLAGISLTSQRADASLIAYICDDALCTGGGDTIVTDQGAGDNFPGSAQVGQINAGAINIGGFTIVTNITQSKPLIGSGILPQLDLTFSAVTSDDLSHTIYLYASDTGFTGSGGFTLSFGGTQTGTGSNSIMTRAWGGGSNSSLDLAVPLGSLDATTTPFGTSVSGVLTPTANPFSLTLGVAITRTVAGTSTGDANLDFTAIPEPGSITMLGMGLIGLVGVAYRRTARK